MRQLPSAILVAVGSALPLTAAHGDDLFGVFVNATDNSGQSLAVTSSSVLNLVTDLIDTSSDFAQFDGVPFQASLTYAGIENAISFQLNGAGDDASLTFELLNGETFTFTGDNVDDQIEDFLKKDGIGTYSKFLAAINRRSLVGVTDGNPFSTTARNAQYAFERWGMQYSLTGPDRITRPASPAPEETFPQETEETQIEGSAHAQPVARDPGTIYESSGFRLRIDASASSMSSDIGDGQSYTIAPSTEYRINRRVGIGSALAGTYQDIEGSQVAHISLHIGLPVRIILPEEGTRWAWQVTPFGAVAGSGSVDMVSGGILWTGGMNSLLEYHPGWGLTLAMTNQVSFHEGVPIKFSDYEFDTEVSQQILKNGLLIGKDLTNSFYVFGSLTHTAFLDDAAIDEYLSPGVGLGLGGPGRWHFRLAYQGDIADEMDVHRAQLGLTLPF